jgi:O-antigen biosynthesis protein
MMQLISMFQTSDANITFVSAAAQNQYSADLKHMGVTTDEIRINDSKFDLYIRELDPDIVLFDRFMTEEQFGWRVAEQCPDSLRVLNTEDLHSLRQARQQAIEMNVPFSEDLLLTSDLAKREMASIYRSDLTLLISEAEINLLNNLFRVKSSVLYYLPIFFDPIDDNAVEKLPAFSERNHFIHIGNFRHPPNLDSVLYLKDEIWPLIREKLPNAELHLYGAYQPGRVSELHDNSDGFLLKGRAEIAKEVMKKARVCLAPLRFGAGLKGKLLEAMECGTPSITTEVGSEGINSSFDWSGFICNHEQPGEFANRAVELYTNMETWEICSRQGFRIINERFTGQQLKNDLIDRLSELRNNLKAHRKENFIGSMLMHHKAASSKYMSLWIEAKNLNQDKAK